MYRRSAAALVIWSCAAVGCAGGIQGEVEGDSVPALLSSALAEAEANGTEVALGIASTLPNTCEAAAKLIGEMVDEEVTDERDFADALDDVGELLQESLPSDYWWIMTALIGEDIDDADGEEVDLSRQDEDQPALVIVLCHNEGAPDSGDGTIDFESECFIAVDGDVEVEYIENERLRVQGEVELTDDVEDRGDDVDLSVSSGFCEPFADAIGDAIDACEDGESSCALLNTVFGALFAGTTARPPG